MRVRLSIPIMAALSLLYGCHRPVATTAAEPQAQVGRYQAVAFPRPNGIVDVALLVDTRDGDLWEMSDSANFGNVRGGVILRYMGRLKTGAKVGEIVQTDIHD